MADKKKKTGASKAPVKTQKQQPEEKVVANDKRPAFEYKKQLYAFKVTTPKRLQVFDQVLPITDIVKDADLMECLIEGNNSFVERIKK